MSSIELKNVTIDIPIYNSQGRSLKKTIMGVATGGRIGLTEKGNTIIRSLDDISLSISNRERVGLVVITEQEKVLYFVFLVVSTLLLQEA